MTETEHMIVTEQVNGRTVYWETTTTFVQMKLKRFYVEWRKVNGVTLTFQKDYDINRMFLPPHKVSRKKKADEAKLVDDESIVETYVEDTFQYED
jgi:phage/plasmid-associated DNA primase